MSINHSPDGWVDLGKVGPDGFVTMPAHHSEQPGNLYFELKNDYSVSFDVFLDVIHPDFWALMFGAEYALYQQFLQYTPFWYLKGNDD